MRSALGALLGAALVLGCSAPEPSTCQDAECERAGAGGAGGAAGAGGAGGTASDGGSGRDAGGAAGAGSAAGAGGAAGVAGASGAGGAPAGGAGGAAAPTAQELLALVERCARPSAGRYATDSGRPEEIPVCHLSTAVYWQADLDVDCDGKPSAACNETTDPYFQAETAAVDSKGEPLDAASLPFVVVPLASERFDYRAAGLAMGSVVAVIHRGQVVYAPIGDLGPRGVIGEGSYALAARLGIDPDPVRGGADSGVTYIAFTGSEARVRPIESTEEAQRLGVERARQLLAAP